jgi:hypothetical protein
MELHTLDLALREPALLVDRLLVINRIVSSLKALRKQAEREEGDFTLVNKLLLKNGQLIVLTDNINEALIVNLIHEAHDQISFTYPGRFKTTRILG